MFVSFFSLLPTSLYIYTSKANNNIPCSPGATISAMFGGGSGLRRCYCSGCTWCFERSARGVHHFLSRANIPAFTTKQEAGRLL